MNDGLTALRDEVAAEGVGVQQDILAHGVRSGPHIAELLLQTRLDRLGQAHGKCILRHAFGKLVNGVRQFLDLGNAEPPAGAFTNKYPNLAQQIQGENLGQHCLL